MKVYYITLNYPNSFLSIYEEAGLHVDKKENVLTESQFNSSKIQKLVKSNLIRFLEVSKPDKTYSKQSKNSSMSAKLSNKDIDKKADLNISTSVINNEDSK